MADESHAWYKLLEVKNTWCS